MTPKYNPNPVFTTKPNIDVTSAAAGIGIFFVGAWLIKTILGR